jgi:uncharacterized Zn-finger protein
MIKKFKGRNDQIMFDASFINLGDEEIQHHRSKVAKCGICEEKFSCEKDLLAHFKYIHNKEKSSCKTCDKVFKKGKHLNFHRRFLGHFEITGLHHPERLGSFVRK